MVFGQQYAEGLYEESKLARGQISPLDQQIAVLDRFLEVADDR